MDLSYQLKDIKMIDAKDFSDLMIALLIISMLVNITYQLEKVQKNLGIE